MSGIKDSLMMLILQQRTLY